MRATASTSVLFSPRRLFIAAGLAALVILVAAIASREFEPRVRQAIVSRLSTSLESAVELGDTRLSFFPPRLRAESLTVRHHGRVDVPPLLVTLKVTSDAVDLADLLTFVASTSPPAAHGTLVLDTAFDLPRGDGDVLDRLALAGSFRADWVGCREDAESEVRHALRASGKVERALYEHRA